MSNQKRNSDSLAAGVRAPKRWRAGSLALSFALVGVSLLALPIVSAAMGAPPTITPFSPQFARAELGQIGETVKLEVTNNNASEMTIEKVEIIASESVLSKEEQTLEAESFKIIADNCPGAKLAAAGGSCSMEVKYKPLIYGPLEPRLLVDGDGGQAEVTLRADATFIELVIINPPSRGNVGTVAVGSSSVATPITAKAFGFLDTTKVSPPNSSGPTVASSRSSKRNAQRNFKLVRTGVRSKSYSRPMPRARRKPNCE